VAGTGGAGGGGSGERLVGQGLAPGLASGPVFHLRDEAGDGGAPLDLEEARARARAALAALAPQDPSHREILEAQAMMLDDPTLLERVRHLSGRLGPDEAVRAAADEVARALEALDDPYLRARAQDVRDVADLWLAQARGIAADAPTRPSVVVAGRLGVAWLLAQPPDRVRAAVVREGAPTSHVAIVAANLGIPLVALDDDAAVARCGRATRLRVRGDEGVVEIDPADETVAVAPAVVDRSAIRLDGLCVEALANVGSVREAHKAVEAGADGIGLFRTELAFAAAGRPLGAGEEAALYRGVVEAMAGLPVTFRTLDVGADKPVAGLAVAGEANPQLGVRGVRLYPFAPALFDQQLAALATVAVKHPGVSIMFPMVGSVEEWRTVHAAARGALAAARARVGGTAQPRLGMMLEVPSALALVPELVAEGVAFFSIGTNDLVQYVYAADRENPRVRVPRVPVALYRLLAAALPAASRAGAALAVCGELGADPLAVPVLAALGVREFSVAVPRLAPVRRLLRALFARDGWRDAVAAAIAAPTNDAAQALLEPLAGAAGGRAGG